jgi:hypothetical protein
LKYVVSCIGLRIPERGHKAVPGQSRVLTRP